MSTLALEKTLSNNLTELVKTLKIIAGHLETIAKETKTIAKNTAD